MAWSNTKDWGVGEVVTAAKLNQFIRDNLRYLKGADGIVNIEQSISVPNISVNIPSPISRMHVRESSDTYAGTVENLLAGGASGGLLVVSAGTTAAVDIFSVNIGTSGGSLTNLFKVTGDGVAWSRGHPWFHLFQTSFGSPMTPSGSPTSTPGSTITVSEPGVYWVMLQTQFSAGNNGSSGYSLYAGVGLDGASVGSHPGAHWMIPPSDPSLWYVASAGLVTVPAGTHNIHGMGFKSGGSHSASIRTDLVACWMGL